MVWVWPRPRETNVRVGKDRFIEASCACVGTGIILLYTWYIQLSESHIYVVQVSESRRVRIKQPQFALGYVSPIKVSIKQTTLFCNQY